MPVDCDDSLSLLKHLRKSCGACQTIIVSHERAVTDEYLTKAANEGVRSIVSAIGSFAEIVSAVDYAFADQPLERAPNLATTFKTARDRPSAIDILSPRELAILRLLARGLTTKQCSVVLQRSESTIDNHRTRMMKKLGVHRNAVLVRLAIKEGLLLLDD